MTLDDFEKLKSRVDDARRVADRAAGAASQLRKRLRDEFGCDGLRAAKKKLTEKEREAKKLEAEFETAATAFESEFPDV